MSYPRQVSVLIVEDDMGPKDLYEQIFSKELLKQGYSVLDYRFAFSCSSAMDALASSRIFHLVIIDLCIPERDGEPPREGVALGMNVLDACSERDDYPVPAILIVTAFAERVPQSDLRSRLKSGFAYGELVVKGGEIIPEIVKALERVRDYVDLGIHVKDGGDSEWPTLSPREEDLLRRSVLEHELPGLAGVDISWWSAEHTRQTGAKTRDSGWTKVLMGRYLLPEGRGLSRVNFFKFAPAGGGEYVVRDAKFLATKLPHVKISSSIVAANRMLLATAQTGTTDNPPTPLNKHLDMPVAEVSGQLPVIVKDVLDQLGALGDVRRNAYHVRDLLWTWHDEIRIEKMLERYKRSHPDDLASFAGDPLQLFRELRSNERVIQIRQRECVHGDLNVTNVAVELMDTAARAYIFDAANIGRRPAVFDIATLEVTAMLHMSAELPYSMVEMCAPILYSSSVEVSLEDVDGYLGPTRAANVLRLVRELRSAIVKSAEEAAYALAVFDQVLIQVGGLQRSANKIARLEDAVLLADLVAGWFGRVGNHLFETMQESPLSVPR